jgi:argininosuccinate lyase
LSKAKQNKMWSGRFKKPLDPAFDLWQRSFAFDQQLITEEIYASIGYAYALQDAGVLNKNECSRIKKALEAIGEDVRKKEENYIHDIEAEDVHHYVEMRLVERVGNIGKKLHTGRSRNEQIATDLRLYIGKWAEQLQRGMGKLAKSFVLRAEDAGTKHTMPAYTHLQRAEPVLVSHWLLAYFEMLMRDIQRLAYVRNTLDECPLGSGAIAGSTVTLDRNMLAKNLGFARPTHNSMDATSDRDFAIEYLHALTMFSLHMTRWAEELIIYSTREYGFVTMPDEYSTGSSAMPQKKNPDALELIRGMSGRIFGSMNALMVTLKGLPLAYNKDLQEMQRPILSATREINAMLLIALGVIRGVEFNTTKMFEAATQGHMNAMAAATYLSSKGLPFREAHEQIGKAVQRCLDLDCELQDLPLNELNKIGKHFGLDFKKNLTLKAVLQCHDNIGGTAPARVKVAIKQAHQRLNALGIQ